MAADLQVLGKTCAEISRSFLSQMPVSVVKEDFFAQICLDIECLYNIVDNEPSYTLVGPWDFVLKAQQDLATWLEKWSCSNENERTQRTILAEMTHDEDCDMGLKTMEVPSEKLSTTIQEDHNYNHFDSLTETTQLGDMLCIPAENEIYMDIKLSNKVDDELFQDPNFPVALVLTSEDHPCVEVVELNVSRENTKKMPSIDGSLSENPEDKQERSKLRKKQYEDDQPYKFFCTLCSFKTKRHSHIAKHARLHERVCKIYSCPDCSFSSIRLCHLERHMRTHKTAKFSCSLCSYSTHKEEFLIRHQRQKHLTKENSEEKSKEQFHCTKCSYMTPSEKFLERHMTLHRQKVPKTEAKPKLKCDDCSYESPSISNYYRHIANVHGDERPHLCNICGLRFKRSDTLNQHRAIHADVEPHLAFECPQCKKYFRSEKLVREHLLTHSDERTFLCEICGASFKTRGVQRKHFKEVHVGIKKHHCSVCNKLFLTKSLLERHVKSHAQIIKKKPHLDGNLVPISKQWKDPSDNVQVFIIPSDQQPALVLNQDGMLVPNNPLAQNIEVPINFIFADNVSSVSENDNNCSSTEHFISLPLT